MAAISVVHITVSVQRQKPDRNVRRSIVATRTSVHRAATMRVKEPRVTGQDIIRDVTTLRHG